MALLSVSKELALVEVCDLVKRISRVSREFWLTLLDILCLHKNVALADQAENGDLKRRIWW